MDIRSKLRKKFEDVLFRYGMAIPEREPLAELLADATLDVSAIAALREAGENMALQLRILSKSSYFTREDAAALAEWEAANK